MYIQAYPERTMHTIFFNLLSKSNVELNFVMRSSHCQQTFYHVIYPTQIARSIANIFGDPLNRFWRSASLTQDSIYIINYAVIGMVSRISTNLVKSNSQFLVK